MTRRILGLIPLVILAAILIWAAVVGSGFDRIPPIMLLVLWIGIYAWMRFTQSGQKALATRVDRRKRKD